MYIYLDETGNLVNSREKHFIVATFTIGDPSRLAKAFRKWQKSRFPRQLQNKAEVKFNNPTLSDILRLKTLQFFVEQDIKIFYSYLSVSNIPDMYKKKDRVHETGKLYLEIVSSTIELYLPLAVDELRIIRDQRTTKGMSNHEFNEFLKVRLLPKLPAKALVGVEAVDSTASPQVQVADWLCGALGRYHEGKAHGKDFFTILHPALVRGEELFSEHWTKIWEK